MSRPIYSLESIVGRDQLGSPPRLVYGRGAFVFLRSPAPAGAAWHPMLDRTLSIWVAPFAAANDFREDRRTADGV